MVPGVLSVVALIIFGGAFGGLADILWRTTYSYDAKVDGVRLDRHHFRMATLNNMVVGAAGAISIQFLLILFGNFKASGSVPETVFLISTSVAAGFASRRILPGVTRQIEHQIQDVAKRTEEITADQELLRQEQQENLWFTRALASLQAHADPPEIEECAKALRALVGRHPKNRYFAMVLGRLLRRLNRLDEAIDVLSNFERCKSGAGERDKDLADVLYNRACYFALKFQATSKPEFREQVLVDLAVSVRIAPENAVTAAGDADFAEVCSDSRFQEILGTKKGP